MAYLCKRSNEEFKHWHALSGFVAEYPASSSSKPPPPAPAAAQAWRTQAEKSTGWLGPWWVKFVTCDNRRAKVYLDGNLIFYTSKDDYKEGGPNPSSSATIWLWGGDHSYRVEVFDSPKASPVVLRWSAAPINPACADELGESPPVNPTTIPQSNSAAQNQDVNPDRPVKTFLNAIARMDMDAAVNESFAPENRLIARAGLEIARSVVEQRGLTLEFSSVVLSTTSNNGTKAVVHATGHLTFRDKDGNSEEDIFDIDFPVSRSGNDWYVDPDFQKIQELLQSKSQ